jgi:hypothetical protein
MGKAAVLEKLCRDPQGNTTRQRACRLLRECQALPTPPHTPRATAAAVAVPPTIKLMQ